MAYIALTSLVDVVDDLRRGRLDLHAHIDASCDRVEQIDPVLQALVPEAGRRARLHAAADGLLGDYPDPGHRPPLFGALVGVKDVMRVEGLPTAGGSALPPEELDGSESAVVTALRSAGALVLGKTRTAEFAYAAPGPTRNPRDPGRTPGGSSHGSAAGVAAGLCPLALGTQTIASTMRPAAYCGVVGYVPTHGRIATDELLFVSRALDRVGLFTADVASMGLAAGSVVAGWRRVSAQRRPALGVAEGPFLDCVEPAARELLELQVAALAAAGYRVRRVGVFEDAGAVTASLRRLVNGELAREHAKLFERYRDRYRPQTAAGIQAGLAVDDQQLQADRRAALQRRRRVEAQRWSAGVDVWVSPAACGPAPEGIASSGAPWLSVPWSYVGLPAVALPAGTVDGLPAGLQLVGGWRADEHLLAWATGIAEAVGQPMVEAGPANGAVGGREFRWY
ncbi:MAG TPA: amidase [Actinomycetes bacterium]|nr:amidase [Actinomycetes bacterium]